MYLKGWGEKVKFCAVRSRCETKIPWPVFTPGWHSQNKNNQSRNCAAEIICPPVTAARTKHKIIVVWWDDDKPRIPGLSRHRVIQGLTWDNISLESCLSRISDILGCSQLCIPVLPRPLPQLSTPWGCCHQSSPSLSQFVCYLSSSVISETN